MPLLTFDTALGLIHLRFRPDAAPETVKYITKLVTSGLYNGCCFYRSDFVIQCGLLKPDGMARDNPYGDLKVNESYKHKHLSNKRGTMAVAHWDPPDCGNADIFINLKDNKHLDRASGGFCVFAEIVGSESAGTVDRIAQHVAKGNKALIRKATMEATREERLEERQEQRDAKRKRADDNYAAARRRPAPAVELGDDSSCSA
eukprot:TRINITY_DN9985_c0_g1_i1.p2 TRINITY_DN9985_c0_g1~~TRINITY_DN9985_c0_g1_i1.p2  ORF type:complete len:237 (+),score=111.22 TRINITY_DN9985_c0_g1_i1:108-713(+)